MKLWAASLSPSHIVSVRQRSDSVVEFHGQQGGVPDFAAHSGRDGGPGPYRRSPCRYHRRCPNVHAPRRGRFGVEARHLGCGDRGRQQADRLGGVFDPDRIGQASPRALATFDGERLNPGVRSNGKQLLVVQCKLANWPVASA